MNSDAELLREYVRNGSDAAFSELVVRYTDLAYSAALREVRGDEHLAKDVTQAVFVSAARKATQLMQHPSISGWLYTSVRYEARNLSRNEQRRRSREREAQTMSDLLQHTGDDVDWTQLLPLLDDGMHALNDRDRHAIVLRFFERKKFLEVASALGMSEDAARKRVQRAIERLQTVLTRKGLPLSMSGLARALETHAVTAAPAGIAASISIASAVVGSHSTLPLFMMLSKTNVIGAICLVVLSGGLIRQTRTVSELRGENAALRAELTNAEIPGIPERFSAAPALPSEERRELLRLRGEVGFLRAELGSARSAARPRPAAVATAPPENAADHQEAISKMNRATVALVSFLEYAAAHGGAFPTNFLPIAAGRGDPDLFHTLTNEFEMLYTGNLQQLTNTAAAIVLREKQAWQSPDGAWQRTYGFADGHSEVHRAADGNFDPWEQSRLPGITDAPPP